MEESASIVLYYKDIEDILFNYYFEDSDLETIKQIKNTRQMLCNIKTKNGVLKTAHYINFTLMYRKSIESLNKDITEKIDVSLTDLWNIINEKISDKGYEIDDIDSKFIYPFGENSVKRLEFITFHLKKKENVKTKKRGWRKHV